AYSSRTQWPLGENRSGINILGTAYATPREMPVAPAIAIESDSARLMPGRMSHQVWTSDPLSTMIYRCCLVWLGKLVENSNRNPSGRTNAVLNGLLSSNLGWPLTVLTLVKTLPESTYDMQLA